MRSQAHDPAQLPIILSPQKAKEVARALKKAVKAMPQIEPADFVEMRHIAVNGEYRTYAVTKKGFVESHDLWWPFHEKGTQVLDAVIGLCGNGPVRIDLGDLTPGRQRLTLVK